ncbi:SDR family NAD(P)-dependent oxidoreductase [Cupriavidus pauculus]|uniref:SDR family NAD(P)-dependent oxidoreductase n=1 Tax=Cupriavidus pauculus TaxID=82633 RepID=UPI0007833F48|nr:SDR family NAD(P)-dependent oxidoreductase [Cupriavidus pauculus]
MTIATNARDLSDRVYIITGAGRGLGASYAKLAASLGAKVVVNDLGRSLHGEQMAESPAEQLVREIQEAGGTAVADTHDVTDFEGARALIDDTVQRFGSVDVLINNAGILRDRLITNMSPEEWDEVIKVHLRGHYCTTRHATTYWKEKAKHSGPVDAALIQTTSIAGLHGQAGQANYATAKSGIATLAHIVHLEMNQRFGVRSYAIAPSARTRLTLNSPGAVDVVNRKLPNGFDYFDPDNVAPFVVWLGSRGCKAPSGSVLGVEGDVIRRYNSWHVGSTVRNDAKRWTFDDIERASDELFKGQDQAFSPISDVMTF